MIDEYVDRKISNKRVLFIFSVLAAFLLFSFYLLFLTTPINLTTADLGRHLENGKYFN